MISRRYRFHPTLAATLAAFAACVWLLSGCGEKEGQNYAASDSTLGDARVDEYLGSATCAECHPGEHEKWRTSHHFHAMEKPSEETVRADFNGSTFERYGVTSRFFREGDKYLVETENEQGDMQVFEVAYTFGWEPLQQYLVRFPDGRMQALPTCWDVEKKRWYHLYSDEQIKHDDPLFWTRSMQNWDHMCADCHSTNLRKQFDEKTQTFSTVFSEMNVACEACHGPGAKHVELAKAGKGWQGLSHFGLADVNSTNKRQLESCAKCHARRGYAHPGHHAGSTFHDHFLPEVAQPWSPDMSVPTYHVDGQILDEVYVYGSYVQSKMYHKGVKCADCHDPHTARTYVKGNQLCMRCHSPKPDNLTLYDSPAHHFHPQGSKGAQCVECHMPEKTYMGLDPRRDHSIRIPRPDLSVKFGTPNACNRCHTDQNASWAAQKVIDVHGPDRPREVRHPEAFHAFRNNKPEAEKLLLDTIRDAEAPAFTRAGALLALRRFLSEGATAEGRTQLKSPDPSVRVAAVSKLENLPDAELLVTLSHVLSDPVLTVRTEAARLLSRLPAASFPKAIRPSFYKALREYKARHLQNLDRPEAHLSLGILAENQRNPKEAEKRYRSAVERESTFVPARMNLATLLSRQGRNREAEKVLREVIRLEPNWGEGHYNLGLLQAEDRSRLPTAADRLQRAARLLPDRPRVHYNLGVALWQLADTELGLADSDPEALARYNKYFSGAAAAIQRAADLQPANPEFPQALVRLHLQANRYKEALPHARRLAELLPEDPRVQDLLKSVKASAGE